MANAVIDIKDAEAFFAELGPMFDAAAISGLKLAALRGQAYIQTVLIPQTPHPPVDRGTYRGAWKVEPLPNGAMLYNNELHTIFIEYGVRPENVKVGSQAMHKALVEWAMRKGLARNEKEAERTAAALARAFRKRGIYNRMGRIGLGILDELILRHLPAFIVEEVEREIRRTMTAGGVA